MPASSSVNLMMKRGGYLRENTNYCKMSDEHVIVVEDAPGRLVHDLDAPPQQ